MDCFPKEIYDQVKFHFNLSSHIKKCLGERAVNVLSIEDLFKSLSQELKDGYKSYKGNFIGLEVTEDVKDYVNSSIKCYLENIMIDG